MAVAVVRRVGGVLAPVDDASRQALATLPLDAELKIWVSGTAEPVQQTFNKFLSIYEVQSVLASYVLR